MIRKPLALANWKMAMTIAESLTFVRDFVRRADTWLDQVDVVLCPPFTAIWAVAQALPDRCIQLGGQNIASVTDPARTGEISATLLADVGCQWVLLGHWEVRRHLGDNAEAIERKVRLTLDARLKPFLFFGEARDDAAPLQETLERQLARILDGCQAEEVATMAFVYEPEEAIGVGSPVTPEYVAAGCAILRGWLRARWDSAVADSVRIIYGGSVIPEYVPSLLACPDVDGLGATRRGRDASSFAEIVRHIATKNPRDDNVSTLNPG